MDVEEPPRDYDEQPMKVYVKFGEFVELQFFSIQHDNFRSSPYQTLRFPLLGLLEVPPFYYDASVNAPHKGLARHSFTDTHLKYLETFLHSGRPLRELPDDYYTGHGYYKLLLASQEAIHTGLHRAITTRNPRALDLLLRIDELMYHYTLNNSENPSERFPYKLKARLFETAAEVYNQADAGGVVADRKALDAALLCFVLLLTTSAESVPCGSPLMVAFATTVGGAFGRWLMAWQRYLPQQIRSSREDGGGSPSRQSGIRIFEKRVPDVSDPMGRRFLNDVVPSRDLFRVPGEWMGDL